MTNIDASHYRPNNDNIYIAPKPCQHRAEDYNEAGFDELLKMQRDHFWYRGRHRFLWQAVKHCTQGQQKLAAIDLGGGCGGWAKQLSEIQNGQFQEIALGDSSLKALKLAGPLMPQVQRYQIDLYDLQWQHRWDVIFLLDVIEHLDDDLSAMKQVYKALRPGGLVFVTTPAFQRFWSYNDDLSHHKRRYVRGDYQRLAQNSGFTLLKARYFMFFLSPALILSRLRTPKIKDMSPEDIQAHLAKTHAVPSTLVNETLALIFNAETPLGWYLPFPWGTSVLGVFQKPKN